jgi:DNA repair protein SbcC/Rad50
MLAFLKKIFLPDEMATRPAPRPSKTAVAPNADKKKLPPRVEVAAAVDALAAIKSTDVQVRKTALASIDDLTVLADRAQNDSDSGVKQMALGRLKTALIDSTRPLAERTRTLNVLETAILEYVAKSAHEAELRRNALAKIVRVGFLGDRAVADADASIRLELVGRIEAMATLERVADAARTKDKAVYRAASEKLAAAKFAAGDQKEIDSRTLALCTRIEVLLRDPPADTLATLTQIDAEWQPLAAKASSSVATRFRGARATIERVLNPPAPVEVEAAPSAEGENSADVVLSSGLDLELADALRRISEAVASRDVTLERLEALQKTADTRLQAIRASADDQVAMANMRLQLNDARAKLRADAAAKQALDSAAADALRASLKKFVTAVDAGDLNSARALEKSLEAQKTEIAAHLHTSDKRDLGDAKAKLGKLLAWERWSANKHRVELCDEVQALAGSGLHPDALQAKITELKARWAELDKLDGLDAEAAKALGMGKRFRALCFEAIKPAQGYFDKRKELRGQKRDETETLVTRAQALLVETATPTPKELLDARSDLAERMRNLDQLDPKARAVLSKQIRDINDQLSAKLNAQRKAAETDKRKLIAKLRRDLIGAETGAAIAAAKTAQAEWKNLARADRKIEDELWAELRTLVDPHFAQAKESAEKQRASEQERTALGEDIVARTRALVSEAQAEHSIASALEKLENEWRAYMQVNEEPAKPVGKFGGRDDDRGFGREERGPRSRDRNPEQRDRERGKDRAFDAAVAEVQRAVAGVENSKRQAQKQLAERKSALCLQLESAWLSGASVDLAQAKSDWSAIAALPNAQEVPLAKRFDSMLSSLESGSAPAAELLERNAARGAEIAMALEYLSGRESPESLKAERMQYQVQRLSSKLSQGSAETAAEEIARLHSEWLALGPLTSAARSVLTARISA